MRAEIKIRSLVHLSSVELDEEWAGEVVRYCVEPLSELTDATRNLLEEALRSTLKWHKAMKGFGDRRKNRQALEEIEKRTDQLRSALKELDPQFANALMVVEGDKAPDLEILSDELERLSKLVRRLTRAGQAAEGAPPKDRQRQIVAKLMRALYEATGEWPDAAKKKGGNFDPHLKGASGEVIRRFFERVDKHVTIGSLVAAVKAGRAVFLKEPKTS